jgi:hypothetical protein
VDLQSLLNAQQHITLRQVESWVRDVSTLQTGVQGHQNFSQADMFLPLGNNTLQSVVATLDGALDRESAFATCEERLMRIASSDGVVRALASHMAAEDPERVQRLFEAFFADQGHANLASYMQRHMLRPPQGEGAAGEGWSKAVITTFTNLHFFLPERHLPHEQQGKHVSWKLGSFETESSLADRVRGFYRESQELLILECDAWYDQDTILLAKFIVDREESEYRKLGLDTPKRVIILVHVSRGMQQQGDGEDHATGERWEACFANEWDLYHIDSLLLSDDDWQDLRTVLATQSIINVLEKPGFFEELVTAEVMACFSRIRYGRILNGALNISQADRVKALVAALKDDKKGLLPLIKAPWSCGPPRCLAPTGGPLV